VLQYYGLRKLGFGMSRRHFRHWGRRVSTVVSTVPFLALLLSAPLVFPGLLSAQAISSAAQSQADSGQETPNTTEDWNKRLQEMVATAKVASPQGVSEYHIGSDDLLDITVFEAPEMNREVRVSASGEISLPLLGGVRATGLTPRELEFVLQELLRRSYMKDPHVGVFVKEMQSHPVSVFGAVQKPGVYQVAGTKSLIEILSLAEGLASDAGDTVIVMRGGAFQSAPVEGEEAAAEATPAEPHAQVSQAAEIRLKDLLESGDPRYNVAVNPGDIVKVTRAGVVYVVGDVKKPGGFVLQTNENISVLKALALAEGVNSTAAKSRSAIIRTKDNGEREEIPMDVGKILSGENPDPTLQPNDIVFVPSSTAKKAALRTVEAVVRVASGMIIWSAR
jgi:polysaccharide export outer membrane protein